VSTDYAGNPTSFPIAVPLPSGADIPSTTVFDTAYEGTLDRTAYLRSAHWADAGTNWNQGRNINPGCFSGGGTSIQCGTWDPAYQRWILGNTVNIGSGTQAQLNSSDDGINWTVLQPALSNPTWIPIAMAVEPLSGTVAVVRSDLSANWSVTTQVPGAASVEQTVTGGMPLMEQGVGIYFYATHGAAVKTWLFVGATGIIGHEPWNGCALGASSSSFAWTNLSIILPSNWAPPPASSTNVVFQWLACTDESFPLAGDANNALFAQCGSRPGTDHSYLLQWNQATPAVFTDITPSFLSATTYQMRGLAWSPVDELWGMVCVDGDGDGHGASPANSYFLTSPDLVTWTTVKSFSRFQAGGLACMGNIWTIVGSYTANTDESNRMIWSNNVSLGSSQTWESSQYDDADSTGSTSIYQIANAGGFPQRALLSNARQFLSAQLFGGYSGPTFIGYALTSKQSIAGIG